MIEKQGFPLQGKETLKSQKAHINTNKTPQNQISYLLHNVIISLKVQQHNWKSGLFLGTFLSVKIDKNVSSPITPLHFLYFLAKEFEVKNFQII